LVDFYFLLKVFYFIEYFTNHELGWPGSHQFLNQSWPATPECCNHRRLKLLQSVLRTLAVSGIGAGLVWQRPDQFGANESIKLVLGINLLAGGRSYRFLIPTIAANQPGVMLFRTGR